MARSSAAVAKRAARVGVSYLVMQLAKLENSGYIAECSECDATRWTVGLPLPVLHTQLARDVKNWANVTKKPEMIVLDVRFPPDYPMGVPFVRIVRPRFQYRTGHITLGGSFCTELLTPAGWCEMTPETLFRSLCAMMEDGDARVVLSPDLHNPYPFVDYSEEEAKEAYRRAAATHGWRF